MKKRVIPVFLSLILLLSSCNGINTFNKKDSISLADTMEFLTSDKCDGRLSGTQGNKEAEKYIEECFNKIGLEKYDGSYLHEYSHMHWKTLSESYKMSVKSSNGEVIECKYGEDFILNYMVNADIKAPLTFNINDNDINDCVIVLEQGKKMPEGTPMAVLREKESFRITPASYNENKVPFIQITPELYKLLKKNEGAEISIKFECDAVEEVIPQNNVVGLIKGNNDKNVIVLSAHFDHSGSIKDKIWRGAIDNASGTAVLIDIAQRLKQYSKTNKLAQDILFCAFNGEESGFQGSEAFVDKLLNSKYDNIYNINVDCVGIKGQEKLSIYSGNEGCNKLIEDIEKQLREDEIEVKLEQEAGGSDHEIFLAKGLCAVGLMNLDMNLIHSLKDDLSNVDYKYIEKLGKSISNYLIKNNDKTYTIDNNDSENNIYVSTDEDKIISKEDSRLKFNQYKFMKIGDSIRVIDRNWDLINTIEDFNKVYPKCKIPKSIGDLNFSNIYVIDQSKEHIVNGSFDKNIPKEQIEKHEIGKVYKIKTFFKNIGTLQITYQKGEGNMALQDTVIQFVVYDKSNKNHMYTHERLINGGLEEFYKYKLSKDKLDIDGLKYQILYDTSNNIVKGLYMIKEDKNRIYHIQICSNSTDWPYTTEEETKDIMKQWNLNDLITHILAGLCE